MPRSGLYPDINGVVVMALRPSTRVQNVAYTGTAGTSTTFQVVDQNTTYAETLANTSSTPPGCTHVRLISTTDCFILFGQAPVATTTNGMYMAAGVPEYFPVDVLDKISVIQATVAGSLNITECS